MADVAARKKKNADAQAAFRLRRTNYITALEQTVEILEDFVQQVQQSYRDSQSNLKQSQQECARLRQKLQERDDLWRSALQKKTGGMVGRSRASPRGDLSTHLSLTTGGSAQDPPFKRENADVRLEVGFNSLSGAMPLGATRGFPQAPPGLHYTGGRAERLTISPAASHAGFDGEDLSTYPTTLSGHVRNAGWGEEYINHSGSTGSSVAHGSFSGDHSPALVGSPTSVAPRLGYASNDASLANSELALLHSHMNGSISPTTPTSYASSSTLVASPFDSNMYQKSHSAGYDAPQSAWTHGVVRGDVTDVSTSRISGGGPKQGETRQLVKPEDHFRMYTILGDDDTQPYEETESIDLIPLPEQWEGADKVDHLSRSSSPEESMISNTLAVIRAQAFGGMRRTRVTKKSKGSNRKAAEAVSSKRRRVQDESDEDSDI